MTGGKDHASPPARIYCGVQTPRIEFAEMCRAVGVKWIKEIDSYDMGSLFQTVRDSHTDQRCISGHIKPPL